ncbi:short transient receptor potential channel 6-like [Melanaphis sacchari]|uniref:short transient receptor potential channel 6-like n=1 Tax=Melanaphis sacchari TaxID=742174 RepID=UPI000DC13872|nr:short transient receptor potential channel 6-like [Melanaphis sacchari]
MGITKETKINMSGQLYSFTDELTPQDQQFFELVKSCNLPAIEEYLKTNSVNINMKFQGDTPLHLAIQNQCEPLVDLILQQKDVKIGDTTLLAITYDNLKLLDRLLEFEETNGRGKKSRGKVSGGWKRIASGTGGNDAADDDDDSEEFPRFMTPLLLATQCGLYETVEYLLNRGHTLDRPHTPRCTCDERCAAAAVRGEVVTDGCERLNAYWAISNPTFICTTSTRSDPVLRCFQLHDELLQCGSEEQVYKAAYTSMAEQVKQFAVDMIVNCRTSDEVKIMLRNRDGCKFRGQFPYPRLITAMDHKQKKFVAHTNIQQVLETAWLGDWIEWKSYSVLRKLAYMLWRFCMLPVMAILGMFAPDSKLNRTNRLPINRMFNSLVAYLVFLVLLFVHSNTDKFLAPRGAPRFHTWSPIVVFVLGHAVEKTKLRLQQGPERFFRNLWNVFDTVKLTLFTVAFLCWALAGAQAGWVSDDLDRKYWHWADPQLVAEALFAVATVMAYMRLLFLCQLNYDIGPMQVSLGKVLYDFAKFATFLVIIMAAFTCGLGTYYAYYTGMVYKNPETGETARQEDSFVTVADTFKTLFWGIFCMTSLDAPNVVVGNTVAATGGVDAATEPHHFTQLIGYGLFAVFEVLMVVVMMNMLVAAMSDTFQRVADNAEYEWLFGRTQVYVSYMLLDDMPPPFNLLPTADWLVGVRRFMSKSDGYDRLSLNGGRGGYDGDGRQSKQDVTEFRELMTEIIKRYFMHRTHVD